MEFDSIPLIYDTFIENIAGQETDRYIGISELFHLIFAVS